MALGDYLSDKAKSILKPSPNTLKKGSVLRAFVQDTNPPKIKIFIVVGFDETYTFLATVFVNTEINLNINFSAELQSLHVLLEAEGRDFLTHDSYVDCSDILPKEVQEIQHAMKNKPEIVIGEISEEDLKIIIDTILRSPKIRGKHKKRYGFFDH